MQEAENILTNKGIRITPMRLLVLGALLEQEVSLGLNEIEKILSHSDRITIYRTLRTFSQNGIVHPIENGTSEVKYALCKAFCTANQHLDRHPHFHCKKCDRIICLETIEIPHLEFPVGYQAEEIAVTIKGVCANCRS